MYKYTLKETGKYDTNCIASFDSLNGLDAQLNIQFANYIYLDFSLIPSHISYYI